MTTTRINTTPTTPIKIIGDIGSGSPPPPLVVVVVLVSVVVVSVGVVVVVDVVVVEVTAVHVIVKGVRVAVFAALSVASIRISRLPLVTSSISAV